jgi:nitrite reductase/ring-hydroxylating ferredoxin subunit
VAETEDWVEVGSVGALAQRALQTVMARRTRIALSSRDGAFAAVSGVCNHVGGPLGDGALMGDYVERL